MVISSPAHRLSSFVPFILCYHVNNVEGGSHLKARDLGFLKPTSLQTGPRLKIQKKSNEIEDKRRFSVHAEYQYVI